MTTTAMAKNAENVPSSQRNTCNFKMVVTSASASSTTTKPMTTGQPRVPRTNLKTKYISTARIKISSAGRHKSWM